MKRILFLLLFITGIYTAGAQHVRVRVGFPVGIHIGAPGPAPIAGGIWVGPEWRWRGGRYECVPGYWADVMNVCLGIGQDLTGAVQYGYRDTGNIPAAGISGSRVTGDDCYNPTLQNK